MLVLVDCTDSVAGRDEKALVSSSESGRGEGGRGNCRGDTCETGVLTARLLALMSIDVKCRVMLAEMIRQTGMIACRKQVPSFGPRRMSWTSVGLCGRRTVPILDVE